MFQFQDKIVVVTGGVQGIGKCICEEFEKAGAKVCVIDLQENDYFQGDISDKETLEKFAEKVIADYGHVPGSRNLHSCRRRKHHCQIVSPGLLLQNFQLKRHYLVHFLYSLSKTVGSVQQDLSHHRYYKRQCAYK